MSNHLVEINNINKSFGKKKVLKDVSFYIDKNEIVGFVGPNGAGKSTTMKCISTLIFPDSGDIKVAGYDVKKQRELALSQIAALIEAPGLFQDVTGRDNIKLFASLKNVGPERIKEIYEFTELNEALDRKVHGYSMGMKQRLALGIAILSKPKFLILDEPTNGLDPTGVINLRNTLLDLVKKEDISILFSSHQLGEVEHLADRIICINQGEIIETPMNILKQDRFIIEVDNPEKLIEALNSELNELKYKNIESNKFEINLSGEKTINELLKVMITNDITVIDIRYEKIDIEQMYRKIYEVD